MAGEHSLMVPARYYVRMAEVLHEQGVDVTRVVHEAGLVPDQLQGEAMLRQDQVERLVDAALQVSGRTGLGLDLGRTLKLSAHSIVGYGMLSSPTVGYALRFVARFFGLVMPSFRMRCRLQAGDLEIVYKPVVSMSRTCLGFHIEAIAAATHWEARDLLEGDMPRYDLYLSIPRPPHADRYLEMLEARCHFGWEMNPGLRMVLSDAVAARPLAMADSTSLKMAEARCAELVRKAVVGRHVSDWVRMMVAEASDGMPTLDELAHTLNLSPRTLDRYLKKEGPGFRELSKRARFDKACSLLVDSPLTVTQIAYELGYADPANFTRAFRQLGKCSPSDYRAGHAAPTVQGDAG